MTNYYVSIHLSHLLKMFSSTADRMPGIIVLPRRRTDPIGYRATFKCIVSGSGNFHVTWSRKDARPLPVGRSRVIPRDNSWILIISSLRTDDQGDYVCSARNRFGIASYSVIISIYGKNHLYTCWICMHVFSAQCAQHPPSATNHLNRQPTSSSQVELNKARNKFGMLKRFK